MGALSHRRAGQQMEGEGAERSAAEGIAGRAVRWEDRADARQNAGTIDRALAD